MEPIKILLLVAVVLVIVIILACWYADLSADYSDEVAGELAPFDFPARCIKCNVALSFKVYRGSIVFCQQCKDADKEPRCLEQESLQNLQNTASVDVAKPKPMIYGNWDYAKVCHCCGACEAGCEASDVIRCKANL